MPAPRTRARCSMSTQPRRAVLMAAVSWLTVVTVASTPLLAQPTQVKPGFNLFSEQQDVEIGRQSAAEAERQLPLLNDRRVEGYATEIIRRLAAAAPGAKYPYQIRVVNASDINAFSLPGGYMYVNRGLIEAARTEPELAAVLAHVMAHVALRHGTHQASKAYLAQAGIGILGGLLGRGGSPSQVIQVLGGLGMNALVLRFSRDIEYAADPVAAPIPTTGAPTVAIRPTTVTPPTVATDRPGRSRPRLRGCPPTASATASSRSSTPTTVGRTSPTTGTA